MSPSLSVAGLVASRPVRAARIHSSRFVPRVGLPRNLFCDRQFDGGAKIFQGLGPKRCESWIANWVYGYYDYRGGSTANICTYTPIL